MQRYQCFGNAGIKAKNSIADNADIQSVKHLAKRLAWDVWRFVPCLVFSILGHDLQLQLRFHLSLQWTSDICVIQPTSIIHSKLS